MSLCSQITFPYPNPHYRVAFYSAGYDIFEQLSHLPNAFQWHLANEFICAMPCINGGLQALKDYLTEEARTTSLANGTGKFKTFGQGGTNEEADFWPAIRSPHTLYEFHSSTRRILQHNVYMTAAISSSGMTGRYLYRNMFTEDYPINEKPTLVNLW